MSAQRYAVYRGEEYLGDGTSYQLAIRFGVTPKTVQWWASPANRRRADAADPKRPRIVAERI